MRTKTIELYQFSELDDKAKEKAREWYRSVNAEDSYWHEQVIEYAKEWLGHLGYTVKDINFTGFWSQGDGACFTGTWSASRVSTERLLSVTGYRAGTMPYDSAVNLEALKRAFPEASATLTHRGRYSHERSIEFSIELDPERELEEAAENEAFKDISRDLMRFIYRSLEKEYDYQNSSEQVDWAIEANAYEFTKEGERA
jgi:hypothetical protein